MKSNPSEIESVTIHMDEINGTETIVRMKSGRTRTYTSRMPEYVKLFVDGKKPFVTARIGCETFFEYN